LFGFPSKKCSKFLLLSLKSFIAEKRQGAIKKRKKELKKWTQRCLKYLKQSVLRCLPKKNKDSPCSLAKVFPSFEREICFQGA